MTIPILQPSDDGSMNYCTLEHDTTMPYADTSVQLGISSSAYVSEPASQPSAEHLRSFGLYFQSHSTDVASETVERHLQFPNRNSLSQRDEINRAGQVAFECGSLVHPSSQS